MNTKTMTTLLRGVLLAAAVLCGIFFLWFLPSYGQGVQQADPEFAWAYWPCLIWAWLFALPIFGAMLPCWRIFGSISAPGGGLHPAECTGYAEHLPSGLCRCADLSGGDVRAGLYGGRQRPADHYHHPHGHLLLRGGGDRVLCAQPSHRVTPPLSVRRTT